MRSTARERINMSDEAVQTTPAPVANTAFGAEVAEVKKHRKVSWSVTFRDFTIPVQVRPYYKQGKTPGFMATLDAGTFMCWPKGMPEGLSGSGTLVVSVPTGADTTPELDEERNLVKLPCKTKFVSFSAS